MLEYWLGMICHLTAWIVFGVWVLPLAGSILEVKATNLPLVVVPYNMYDMVQVLTLGKVFEKLRGAIWLLAASL